jgi:GTP pyrophosphokinase
VTSGDTIEILTSSNQTPHRDWLKFVRTSRAKTKIKHWIKIEEQKRSLEIGWRLLEAEIRRHGLPPSQVFKSAALLDVAKQEGYATVDELAVAVGFGHVATAQVIGRLVAPTSAGVSIQPDPVSIPKVIGTRGAEPGVQVKGGRDLLMQLSRCCNPVPGDRILGYITRGRGLTIHSVDCPNLEALDYDRERLVEVEWDTATLSQHAVKIAVIAEDKTAIAECDANISRAEIITREDRKAELDFVVEIADTSHLNRVLKAVERVEGVITARRLRSWREKS